MFFRKLEGKKGENKSEEENRHAFKLGGEIL